MKIIFYLIDMKEFYPISHVFGKLNESALFFWYFIVLTLFALLPLWLEMFQQKIS